MIAAVKYDSQVPTSRASRSLVASVRPQRVRDTTKYSSSGTSGSPEGDALVRQVSTVTVYSHRPFSCLGPDPLLWEPEQIPSFCSP